MNTPVSFDIFISYDHEDIEFALELQAALGRQGWTVFIDREIPNASRWRDVLSAQLDQARCVLVLWSRSSIKSSWVRKEASRGLDRKVFMHVTIDDASPPARFRAYEYRHLAGWPQDPHRTEYSLLLRDIAEKLGIEGAVGTLPDPGPYRVITDDHIALVHTSWVLSSTDSRYDPRYPFVIELILFGSETARKRVENVIYYFDPAYAANRPERVDPLLKAYVHVRSDWTDNFSVKELANGYSMVRAKVKVRDQASIVELSRFVNLSDAGPKLAQQFPPPGS